MEKSCSSDPGENDAELGTTPPEMDSITTLIGAGTASADAHSTSALVYNMRFYKTLPSSSYSTLTSYQIPQVYDLLKMFFPETITTIVDATAHIGGDAILFASAFPFAKIIALDKDPNAIECLKHNTQKFSDFERFDIRCMDCIEWIRDRHLDSPIKADFYYFDPPWGGPKYYLKKEISLALEMIQIADVINMVFAKNLTKKVLLKVPRNFAYPSFKSSVKGTCKLYYIKKPQKNGSVAYGLVLITDDT